MNKFETLKSILAMAEDDNQKLLMSTTVLDAGTVNDVSHVTFQVDKSITSSAGFQSAGLPGDYICCAFFIDRKELKEYKKR